jgi:uncharacterized membrane protein YebE (DUF533 family)
VNSLDVEQLLGSVINGALGGKKKKHRGVTRFLTGGKSSFLNASTLLALGGLAWGVYETMSQGSGGPGPTGPASGAPPVPSPAAPASPVVPPPLPNAARTVVPPPLPSQPAAASSLAVAPEVLRVIRLTLSAARADGTLTPNERDAILAQARSVGAEALIAQELDAPRGLDEIVGTAPGGKAAEDLYTLAFAIVRADEQVLPNEREYLATLADRLGLAADTITRLEAQAAERIASQG